MKIAHVCLSCFYIEGWGYQENLLTRMHKHAGYDVVIMARAQEKRGDQLTYVEKDYINEDGIPVRVLRLKGTGLIKKMSARLCAYSNVYEELNDVTPDVIFVHGGQSVSLKDVLKYCKKHKETVLYIDQHADYYNSPITSLKSRLNAKFLLGRSLCKSAKYVKRYWGTTPWRCQYLNDVYGLPKEKIGLLVMGGNDEKIRFDKREELRREICRELNIDEDDFVIVTGGKIDKTKNIHLLMRAVAELGERKIKLIVFGNPNAQMKPEIEALANNESIRFIGWIPADKAYDYFLISDLGFFPGTHSVLWEQACACGLPCVFKDWEGMRHVDMGGNCEFLLEDSAEAMRNIIFNIYSDVEKTQKMKYAAENCKKEFFYSEIAKRALEIDQ